MREDAEPGAKQLAVAMIVSGFPTADEPERGIFNLRAARAISRVAHARVIFLRAWRPGRPWRKLSCIGDIPVLTVVAPQIPSGRLMGSTADTVANVILYRTLGELAIRSSLRTSDIVHSGDAITGIVAASWVRRARRHHVVQLIGSDTNSILPRIRARYPVPGWHRSVHGVACNSNALRKKFQSLYPDVPNVRVVYRGVDLEVFDPVGPASGPLAARRPVRFLFLGGFPEYTDLPSGSNTKGGLTLLSAWRAAETELVRTGASLLLGGPDAGSRVVTQWRATLKAPERVLVTGRITPADVPGYLRSADAVLVPSMEEGLPNISMEASACGRPVFGSAVGGIPEVIAHEETGVLVEPGNLNAWGEALVQYSRDPDRLRVMGRRARQRMEKLFDARAYAPQMLDLYRAALAVPLPLSPTRRRIAEPGERG
jgi:glycosyltransferase involved in cell wall biosynthesis